MQIPLLVIDLEATCDDDSGNSIPKAESEIIEIGAVLVTANYEPLAEFQTFIRPRRHARLTPFCTRLTSITQEDVEAAPVFSEAIRLLRTFIYKHTETPPIFCSWGDYDRRQFNQDSAHHNVELPFRGDHVNLKKEFSKQRGTSRRFGMAGALAEVGLELIGTHHRGIDDARNIARLLPWCLGSRD